MIEIAMNFKHRIASTMELPEKRGTSTVTRTGAYFAESKRMPIWLERPKQLNAWV